MHFLFRINPVKSFSKSLLIQCIGNFFHKSRQEETQPAPSTEEKWISFTELPLFFTQVTICYPIPSNNLHSRKVEGSWNGKSAGDEKIYDSK